MTKLDHDANVAPWLELQHDLGIVVRFVEVTDDMALDYDDLSGSSATGRAWSPSRSPRTRSARRPTCAGSSSSPTRAGALAWADAVHYGPHGPIDVAAWDVDVLICSPYKFYGPHLGRRVRQARSARGAGARTRCGRRRTSRSAHRFELGTLQHELLAGFVAAVDYIDSLGWDAITGHERALGAAVPRQGCRRAIRLHGLADDERPRARRSASTSRV